MLDKKERKKSEAPSRVALLLETSRNGSRGSIRGVFKYARRRADWRVEFEVGGANELRLPDLSHWNGDGAIGHFFDEETEKAVLESGIPFVFTDPPDRYVREGSPFFGYSSVRTDSADVARKAAKYLLGLGLERFAFVGAPAVCDWSTTRERVFYEEITSRGLRCDVFPSPTKNRGSEAEEREAERWLKSLRPPVGIFAANDERGVWILDVCRHIGLRVPDDAAILGVDADALLCRSRRPELSSVAFDYERFGFEAARILDAQMRGAASGKEVVLIPASKIVVRGSTKIASPKNEKVAEALEFIRLNAGLNIGVGDVARRVGLSKQWIGKLFREERGRTIYEEILRARLDAAAKSIAETDRSFKEIGALCGFVDGDRLGKLFRSRFGVSPSEYRASRRGAN